MSDINLTRASSTWGKLQNANKINEELNKWRDIPCTEIGRLNIVKMSFLPNLTYILGESHSKPQQVILHRHQQTNTKFIWEGKTDPELPAQYWKRKQSQKTDIIWLQDLLQSPH